MIEALYQKFLTCKGVSTDTRKITPDVLFFALKGPNFNANAFAEEALEKGARYVVIDEEKYKKDERFILVDDVLTSFQQLANYYRKTFDIPFIGINGTNGKTTTKELAYAVLSQKYKTHATAGNLNNNIGVPLTLLGIPKDAEMAVIELGANAIGEIDELCRIAEPTHGLTTNIGKAHLEGFGGLAGAIQGESELYEYLIETKRQAFLNTTDPIFQSIGKRLIKPILFPGEQDFLSCKLKESNPFLVYIDEQNREIQTQLIGAYNYQNIAAALCIGKFFGVAADAANIAIQNYIPANKRSQIVKTTTNMIILDAYNANPDSMKVAIENLVAMKAPAKVAILGDMYELGDATIEEHRILGELLVTSGFDQILLCGKHMHTAKEACPAAEYFADKKMLEERLENNPISHATILIKASRGLALETVVPQL